MLPGLFERYLLMNSSSKAHLKDAHIALSTPRSRISSFRNINSSSTPRPVKFRFETSTHLRFHDSFEYPESSLAHQFYHQRQPHFTFNAGIATRQKFCQLLVALPVFPFPECAIDKRCQAKINALWIHMS